MRRAWLFAVLLAPALADDATLSVRQVDADGFPTVKLYVSVTDADGNPLTDVAPGSFRVEEDRKEANAPDVPSGSEPVTSFLVIDRSGSMSEGEKMAQAKEAATRFVEMMRPGDRVGVIAFDSSVETLTDPIEDAGELKAYVRGLRPEGETACFSAVRQALEAMSGRKGRRSVIVLTDGMDNQSEARGDTVVSVSARAVELGVPVFAIGLGENALGDVLGRLAQRSHGKYAFAPDAQGLVALFQRQAEQIQKEFVLTYASPRPVQDGSRRSVRVRATWRGREIEGTGAYAPKGIVPMGTPKEQGGAKAWTVFVGLLIVLAFLGAAPTLLKRAAEKAGEGGPAPEPAKGRVRVIAPTQAPPPPGRVKIVSSAEATPAPEAAAPTPTPAEGAKPAPRVRILPPSEEASPPPPEQEPPATGEPSGPGTPGTPPAP